MRVVYPYNQARKLAKEDVSLLYKYRTKKMHPDELALAPESYVLLSRDNHYFRQRLIPRLCKDRPPVVVYSMWSGYLQRGDLPAFLAQRAIELVEVHSGGHAGLDDLVRLANACKPRMVIPIHTFHAERYADHFPNVVRLENGRTLAIESRCEKGGQQMAHRSVIRRYLSGDEERLAAVHGHLKRTIKLINNSGGEYSLQLREDYFNIYYRGNSVAKVDIPRRGATYSVSIHKRFLNERPWASEIGEFQLEPGLKGLELFLARRGSSHSRYQKFEVVGNRLYWFFQKSHLERLGRNIRRVNAGEETVFEQLVMTDNPPRNNFIIIDRQVADHVSAAQMDLLALSQRNPGDDFHFVVMELKLGRNKELEDKVAKQLQEYITRIGTHIHDYADCYELNYRQKWDMGLMEPYSPTAPPPEHMKIDRRPESVEGLVVVAGYSQVGLKAILKLKERHPDVRVLPLTNVLKIENAR